jgi:hypothetical protein
MLLNTQRAQLSLADDEVARLRDACDSRVEVTHGNVWLTVEGDLNDVMLSAGESYLIASRDLVTVSAIRGPAALRVRADAGPHASCPAARTRVRPSRLQQLLAGVSLSSEAFA